jgi:ribosome biogenesis ATPase
MERRIVAQLLTCMDALNEPHQTPESREPSESGQPTPIERPRKGHVIVIGATNRPDSLDPALRRAGRFDREIGLGIPDEEARVRIMKVIAGKLRLEGAFDFKTIAKKTPGFVGADLQALTTEAAAVAVKRIFTGLNLGDLAGVNGPSGEVDPGVMLENQTGQGGASGGAAKGGRLEGQAPGPVRAVESEALGAAGVTSVSNATEATTSGPETLQKPPSNLPETRAVHIESGPSMQADMQIEEPVSNTQPPPPQQVVPELPLQPEISFLPLHERPSWRSPFTPEQLATLSITMPDFEAAIPKVQPSSKREGFATIPDVTWADVGSLDEIKEELEYSVSVPIKCPEQFQVSL